MNLKKCAHLRDLSAKSTEIGLSFFLGGGSPQPPGEAMPLDHAGGLLSFNLPLSPYLQILATPLLLVINSQQTIRLQNDLRYVSSGTLNHTIYQQTQHLPTSHLFGHGTPFWQAVFGKFRGSLNSAPMICTYIRFTRYLSFDTLTSNSLTFYFSCYTKSILVSISFRRHHFYFYIILVLSIATVFVSYKNDQSFPLSY